MFSILWDLALSLLVLLSLPRFLWRFRKSPALKQALLQKMGFGFPSVKGKVIWLHAVSVGEVKAASKLVEGLKAKYPDHQIVVSTTTLTGNAEAKRSIKSADHIVFFPIDLSFIIKKVLNTIKPSIVILVESDFWYNFQTETKKRGAKIVLVNGKLSEKSQKGYLRLPWLTKKLFQSIDLFLLQSVDYVERFLSLGVDAEKIIPIGNLKLDNEPRTLSTVEKEQLEQKLNLYNRRAIVFGSTHEGEEALALDVASSLLKRYSDLLILIVPRHPERFDRVADLIQERGHAFSRLSAKAPSLEKIVLVDAMGALGSLYQVSTIAIVGGTFIPTVGGHNIIEPLAFKVPVVYGPYIYKQPEFNQLVLKYGAGIQASTSSLQTNLEQLLDDEQKRSLIGSQGLKLVEENRGVTVRAINHLKDLLQD